MVVYTMGIWTVKPGHEDAFIAGWHALAEWTISRFPDATGVLVRDRETPSRFISFGPWEDEQAVQHWRNDPDFGAHLAGVRRHLDDFQPGTFDLVTTAGNSP